MTTNSAPRTAAHNWAFSTARDVQTSSEVWVAALRHQNYGAALRMAGANMRDAERALVCTVWAWRSAGASWAAVADAMGITRQAAHKRFAAEVDKYQAELEGRYVGENMQALIEGPASELPD